MTFESDKNGEYFRTQIVAPGLKRYRLGFLWDKMKIFLEEADEIVVIGFALNDYEVDLRDFISSLNLKRSLEIKIVNPQSDIEEKYQIKFDLSGRV